MSPLFVFFFKPRFYSDGLLGEESRVQGATDASLSRGGGTRFSHTRYYICLRRFVLKIVRRILRRLDILLQSYGSPEPSEAQGGSLEVARRCRIGLQALDLDEEGRHYLDMHLERLVRTLTLVPPASGSARILELGCYMQMTPLLVSERGYSYVRGAYLGPKGSVADRTVRIAGQETFSCRIDLFDAERDRFPYGEASFEVVLACEILEHLVHDPLHMLLECRRVLVDDGTLLLTTPNSVSLTCVARALLGQETPQVFSKYPHPRKDERCGPHVREYAPAELASILKSAGFQVEWLRTES